MPTLEDLRSGGTVFDPFLYAQIGTDRNNNSVTVVSVLARLGLEPWDAAAELAALHKDEARARLAILLGGCRDVPALAVDKGAIAARLAALLPETAPTASAADPATQREAWIYAGIIMVILAVFLGQAVIGLAGF